MREPADFECYSASLIVVEGGEEGDEHRLERPRWLVGNGPDVDASFDDPDMSPRHALIEFAEGRFRVSDLGDSGIRVNGEPVTACELRHGDRIGIGSHVFQLLIERKDALPLYAPTFS